MNHEGQTAFDIAISRNEFTKRGAQLMGVSYSPPFTADLVEAIQPTKLLNINKNFRQIAYIDCDIDKSKKIIDCLHVSCYMNAQFKISFNT